MTREKDIFRSENAGEVYGDTTHTHFMPTSGNDTGGLGGEEPSYGGSNWIYNATAREQ